MEEVFRPEFLNRIDEIVEFEPLSREQIAAIVELQLRRLRQRLVENPLALRLLESDFAEGDSVLVDAADGALVFEKAELAEPAAA